MRQHYKLLYSSPNIRLDWDECGMETTEFTGSLGKLREVSVTLICCSFGQYFVLGWHLI